MASHVVVLNINACTRLKFTFLIEGKVLHYGYVNLAAIWHKHVVLSHPPSFTAAVPVFFQAVSGGVHMTPL